MLKLWSGMEISSRHSNIQYTFHLLFKGGDAGVWYRKESPESTKSKKRSNSRDNKKPTGKSGQHSIAESTTQSNETSAKKVSSWSSL